FASVAMAVDYGASASRRTKLQQAADSAALGAVTELALVNQDPRGVESVAQSLVSSNLRDAGNIVVAARVLNNNALEVNVSEKITNVFGRITNYPKTEIQVRAVAQVLSTKLCLLALEPKQPAAISLKTRSRLTGLQCSLFSNSKDKAGIRAQDFAQVNADLVCSAGGVDGKH